jgi:hypothetical protein
MNGRHRVADSGPSRFTTARLQARGMYVRKNKKKACLVFVIFFRSIDRTHERKEGPWYDLPRESVEPTGPLAMAVAEEAEEAMAEEAMAVAEAEAEAG